MKHYMDRESGVGYYYSQRMAEEKAVMEEAIVRDHKEIEILQQRIESLEQTLNLRSNVYNTHISILYEELTRIKNQKPITVQIKQQDPNTLKETDTELRLTKAEIVDLRKWMPDLKHKHKENLDNARTTDE